MLFDELRVSMQVDEDFRDAGAGTEVEPNVEQRPASDRQQAFGNGVGKRAQARAMAPRQQESFQSVASGSQCGLDLRQLPPKKEARKSIVCRRARHGR